MNKLKTIGYIMLAILIAIGVVTFGGAVIIAIHLLKLIVAAILLIAFFAAAIYLVFIKKD